MAGDTAVLEAVGRIEATTGEIKTEQAGQTTILRSMEDLLREVFKAITPEDAADSGVPLDELLAQLIMGIREHGRKLDLILRLLQGDKAGSGSGTADSRAAPPPIVNGAKRNDRQ